MDEKENLGVSLFPKPVRPHRRRMSDVTWPRVAVALGFATLGILALVLPPHSEMVAGLLIGGAIGSNVPLTKGGTADDRKQ